MLEEVQKLEKKINKSHPHISNLITKYKLYKDPKSKLILKDYLSKYIEINEFVSNNQKITKEFLEEYVQKIEDYLSILRENIFFSHQSDLISSVIPEFFCQIYKIKLKEYNLDFIVSGQENIIIDFQLQHNEKKTILFKEKRVDVVVYKKVHIKVNNDQLNIVVPIIALENKVNLDKNMIYGIINTSHSIKKIFPNSLYCLITEFADLNLKSQNFKYSDIDEIYILRKQKRSEFRLKKRVNKIDVSLIEHNIKLFEDKISMTQVNDLSLEDKMKQYGKLII